MSEGGVQGPVAVAGLGAIGGSLARALADLVPAPELRGWASDPDDVAAAVASGVIERAPQGIAELAEGAAWLVVATPLSALGPILEEAAPVLAPETRVLDVGSLQAPALAAADAAGLTARFVACHPMAGTEASGFGASRADLFRGAPVYLSAALDAPPGAGRDVERFWSALGAAPEWVEPDLHDAQMVVASHLPQLVANALAEVMADGGLTPADLGPGGLDMTRLAASDPVMWRDLLGHSSSQASALLRLTARTLERWARTLDGDDLDEVERRMARTRDWRRS